MNVHECVYENVSSIFGWMCMADAMNCIDVVLTKQSQPKPSANCTGATTVCSSRFCCIVLIFFLSSIGVAKNNKRHNKFNHLRHKLCARCVSHKQNEWITHCVQPIQLADIGTPIGCVIVATTRHTAAPAKATHCVMNICPRHSGTWEWDGTIFNLTS